MGYARPAHQATGINIAKIRIFGLLDTVGGHYDGTWKGGELFGLILPGCAVMTVEMAVFLKLRIAMTRQHFPVGVNIDAFALGLLEQQFQIFQVVARNENCFPGLRAEIELIVDAFNREVYGLTTTDRETLSRLRSALRRMKRLRYWPSRIKVWFFQ